MTSLFSVAPCSHVPTSPSRVRVSSQFSVKSLSRCLHYCKRVNIVITETHTMLWLFSLSNCSHYLSHLFHYSIVLYRSSLKFSSELEVASQDIQTQQIIHLFFSLFSGKHPSLFPFIGTRIDCSRIYWSHWPGDILLVLLPGSPLHFSNVEDHLSLGGLPLFAGAHSLVAVWEKVHDYVLVCMS